MKVNTKANRPRKPQYQVEEEVVPWLRAKLQQYHLLAPKEPQTSILLLHFFKRSLTRIFYFLVLRVAF